MTSVLAQKFLAHEDREGAELVREFVDQHGRGKHSLELNVWFVDLDLDEGTIHLTHDFDPYEGSMTLVQFFAEIDGLLRSDRDDEV